MLDAIDAFAEKQKDQEGGRPEAIRRLVELGLKKHSTLEFERDAAMVKSDATVRAIRKANEAAYQAKLERLRKERLARLATGAESGLEAKGKR